MSFIPVPTHVSETAVIDYPCDVVWSLITTAMFSWWDLVSAVVFSNDGNPQTLGSVATVAFKDGAEWTIQIVEYSNARKTLTFEVIGCTPVLPMTSVVHTISVSKITSTNSSYVQWVTDFSNDVTAEVVADSSFKRLEAFNNLASAAQREARKDCPVVVVVVLRLKEENSDAAREAFLATTAPLVQTVRQEEGCLHYSLLSSPNDRNMFAFVERWANNRALAAHSVTPHMEEIRPTLRNFSNVLSFKTCWDTVSAKVPNFKTPDSVALDGSTVRICNSYRVVDKPSFLRLARDMCEEFLKQDGCLEYSFAEVMGARDEIMSIILWRDQSALRDSHAATPRAGELLAEFQKFHTRLFSDAWINAI